MVQASVPKLIFSSSAVAGVVAENAAPQPGKKRASSAAKQTGAPAKSKRKEVAKRQAPTKGKAKAKTRSAQKSDTESKGLFVTQDSDRAEWKPNSHANAAPSNSDGEFQYPEFSTSKGTKREATSSPSASRPAKRRCRKRANTRVPFLSTSEDSSS